MTALLGQAGYFEVYHKIAMNVNRQRWQASIAPAPAGDGRSTLQGKALHTLHKVTLQTQEKDDQG